MKKWLLILIIFLLLPAVNAKIPIIEFNMSRTEVDNLAANLPYRFLATSTDLMQIQESSIILDITKLVILPKGNFTFSYKPIENMDITINKNYVTITPSPNWQGDANIVIYLDGIDQYSKNKLKEIFNEDLFLKELKLDYLNNIFDKPIYTLILNKATSLINERKDINYKVDIIPKLTSDGLDINVGKDVFISTKFTQEGLRKKPSIDITVNAELVKITRFDQCSNSIKDDSEIDVDCGGPCQPCLSKASFFIPIIISLFIVFVMLFVYIKVDLIRSKIRKVTKIKKKIEIDIFKETFDKINNLNLIKNTKDKAEKFSFIVRKFFGSLFKIRYEFTYEELNNELIKRKISNKNYLLKFFKKLSEIEYSNYKISEKELNELIKIFLRIVESFKK